VDDVSIGIAESDADLRRITPVLLELRPAFTEDTLMARIKEQQHDGYRVAYLATAGRVACVAGFRIEMKLAWGRHLYVDDLVTADVFRSTGAGARMIAWLKGHALEHGCGQLHLDSGVQRFPAHRFYLREGFDISSHHFAITDLGRRAP
jgi:GNAT superfamily N-acetyltransferase